MPWTRRPRAAYTDLQRLELDDLRPGVGWFEAYRVSEAVVVFYEARHVEETICTLVLGSERAALIDSGCGIAPLRGLVSQVTSLPVLVVNTHTHAGHIGGNHEFEEIAVLDHPESRAVARRGLSRDETAPFVAAGWSTGPSRPASTPRRTAWNPSR